MKLKSVEKLEKSKVVLEVEVESPEFEKAMDRSYHKNVGKISVPGFRKGKAPRKIIERMYGANVFTEDALNFAYPEAYEAALKESGVEPVDQAEVEVTDLNPDGFTFKATVTVKPEVKMGEYKGLTADKLEVSVSEQDIEDELKRLQERNSRLVSVEREAKDGDTVVIDFEGFVDGIPFEGGKAEKYSLKLGSGHFIPGFEEQLVGVKAGDEKAVNVTFPEQYQSEELAGKDAVFQVKVHEVKETEMPVLDDEFAKDVSEMDTLDELKKSIKEKILESRQKMADDGFENLILDQVVANMTVELPEVMVESQLDKITEDFANRVASQGLSMESYLQMSGMDMESFRKNFRDGAERQVKIGLALEEIAKLEKLEVTPEEIEDEYKKLSEQYGMSVERVKAYIPQEAMVHDIMSIKTSNFIKDNSKANMIGPDQQKAKETTKKKSTAKASGAKSGASKTAKGITKAASNEGDAPKKAEKKADGTPEKKTSAKKTTTKKTVEKKVDGEETVKAAPKKRTTKKTEKTEEKE